MDDPEVCSLFQVLPHPHEENGTSTGDRRKVRFNLPRTKTDEAAPAPRRSSLMSLVVNDAAKRTLCISPALVPSDTHLQSRRLHHENRTL